MSKSRYNKRRRSNRRRTQRKQRGGELPGQTSTVSDANPAQPVAQNLQTDPNAKSNEKPGLFNFWPFNGGKKSRRSRSRK